MEEIDMTQLGPDPNDLNSYQPDDAFGQSGLLGGGIYGPSVASSVFVSETIGPGMKAQKSAFNINNQWKYHIVELYIMLIQKNNYSIFYYHDVNTKFIFCIKYILGCLKRLLLKL